MRSVHDVGELIVGRPRDIEITYSQHRCSKCKLFFSADTSEYASPKSLYTHLVGCAFGGEGWFALSNRELAVVARSSRHSEVPASLSHGVATARFEAARRDHRRFTPIS